MEVAQLNRDAITPNPNQPRKFFDGEALQELADSIAEHGLMQPITVRARGDGQPFEIIAGERRWRAAGLAGMTEVPCIVLRDIDDETAFVLATTENVARKDMTIIEEANAYAQIVALGKDAADVGKLFGKTAAYIQYRLDLLNLRPDIQHLLARGMFDRPTAHAMSSLSYDGQADVLAKYNEGRFPTYEDALRYAVAVQKREAQPCFLGPLFGEPMSEQEAEARQRTKRQVEDAFDKINKLAAVFEDLLEMEPEVIASVYGPKVMAARDRMQEVSNLASRVKAHMKDAAAAYAANTQ